MGTLYSSRERASGIGHAAVEVREEAPMLHYAIVFFVLALVAAVFGFGGIAAGAATIGKVLFVGFLVLAVLSMVTGRRAGRIT